MKCTTKDKLVSELAAIKNNKERLRHVWKFVEKGEADPAQFDEWEPIWSDFASAELRNYYRLHKDDLPAPA